MCVTDQINKLDQSQPQHILDQGKAIQELLKQHETQIRFCQNDIQNFRNCVNFPSQESLAKSIQIRNFKQLEQNADPSLQNVFNQFKQLQEIQEFPDLEVLSPNFPGQRKLSDNNQLPTQQDLNVINQEGSNKQLIQLQKCSIQEFITLKRSNSGKNLENDKLEEFKNLISNQISQTPTIQPKSFEKDSVKQKINLSMNKNPDQAQTNKPVKQQSNTSSMLRLRKPGMTAKLLDIEKNVKNKGKGIINQSETTKRSNYVLLKQQ